MGFPVLRGTPTTGTGASPGFTVTLPSGIQSGDMLFIYLALADQFESPRIPQNYPGWDYFVTTGDFPTNTYAYWKISDGTETTIDVDCSRDDYAWIAFAYEAGSFDANVEPIRDTGGETYGTSNSPSFNEVMDFAPNLTNSMYISSISLPSDETVTGTPTGWSSLARAASRKVTIEVFTREYDGVEEYSNHVYTLSASQDWRLSYAALVGLGDGNVSINIDGVWKDGVCFINIDGVWKQTDPWDVNIDGTWKG